MGTHTRSMAMCSRHSARPVSGLYGSLRHSVGARRSERAHAQSGRTGARALDGVRHEERHVRADERSHQLHVAVGHLRRAVT
jgi:hypothetical protein